MMKNTPLALRREGDTWEFFSLLLFGFFGVAGRPNLSNPKSTIFHLDAALRLCRRSCFSRRALSMFDKRHFICH